MILSNKHKLIFIHLHKTAGQSISAALENYLGWNDIIIGGTKFGDDMERVYGKRFRIFKHSSASTVRKLVGEEIWSAYSTFSIIRDPIMRSASLYSYAERRAKYLTDTRVRTKLAALIGYPTNTHFTGFMKAFHETQNFSEFIRHEDFLRSEFVISQYNRLSDPSTGNLIVQNIFKFEEIHECEAFLKMQLNAKSFALPKNNVSRSKEINLEESDKHYLYTLFEKDYDFFYSRQRF